MLRECPPLFETKFTNVEGLNTQYYISGAKNLINKDQVVRLAFPGAGEPISNMWPVMAAVSKEGEVVIGLNPPGIGETEPFLDKNGRRRPFTTKEYVKFTCHFLEALDIKQIAGWGISNGAAVMVGLAIHYPHLVERVAAFNGYGWGSQIPHGELLDLLHHHPGMKGFVDSLRQLPWIKPMVDTHFERLLQYRGVLETNSLATPNEIETCGYWQAGEILIGRPRTNYLPMLDRLKCPILIAHSDRDGVIPWESAHNAWETVCNTGNTQASFKTMESCGHRAHLENTAQFSDLLADFMSAKFPQTQQSLQPAA